VVAADVARFLQFCPGLRVLLALHLDLDHRLPIRIEILVRANAHLHAAEIVHLSNQGDITTFRTLVDAVG
jgi:hypothetical protein